MSVECSIFASEYNDRPMKRLVDALLVLCLLCSCTDREHYARLLAEAEQMNADYVPFTSDSTMLRVVDYYDSHGTPNERLRAYYMLGCVYRDLGEAPHALDCFHDAIMCADTTGADCDFRTLSRVHSQTAALLGEQLLPRQQLEELHLQYADAMRAKDTLCALNAMGQMTNAYDMLNMPDSSIIISKNLIKAYQLIDQHNKAAIYSGGIGTSLVDIGRYQEAADYFDIYESGTGFFNENREIEAGREIYYGTKGRYFLGINHYDSAEYYFRKELRSADDLNNREYAYRGLFLLYQKTGQRDSMSKYAQLAYETTDAHFQEKETDELRHMQSLYNYSRNQSIARQKTAEANHNHMMMLIFAFALVLAVAIGYFVFSIYRRRKHEQIRIMQQRYEHDVEALEQAKYDLMKMQEAQITHLVAEKEADIARLQKRLETYGQSLSPKSQQVLEDGIAGSVIYQRLCYLVMHPREKVTQDEWKQLSEMIDRTLPHFRSTLYGACPSLKPSDYDICLLDHLHFSPSEIAVLTGYGLSTITMKRIRLLDKLFHLTGKGDQFDVLIRNIH